MTTGVPARTKTKTRRMLRESLAVVVVESDGATEIRTIYE
jgi:hypothetical protein